MNLKAPLNILNVWRSFDNFPMETLTKAWFLQHTSQKRQRTVSEMVSHRLLYGASGNCFDLAIWLMSEFKKLNIHSYPIGENWGSQNAHVALIALGDHGERYLCDLGDLWIEPINLELKAENEPGFFTGALISTEVKDDIARIEYKRSNGKKSFQKFNLKPISDSHFQEAAHFSQSHLSDPLVEMRIFNEDEVVHWEYEENKSFFSSMTGLRIEEPLSDLDSWALRIERMTNMKSQYVKECLEAFNELSS